MQIPVLIERVEEEEYRATGGSPLSLTASGATRDEALSNLRALIQDRIQGGAEVVPLEVDEPNPWLRVAGMLKEEPLFDDWQEAIREYRRQVDEDRSVP